jgi:hypothetical protein
MSLHEFLTSVPDEEKTLIIHWIRGWVGLRASLDTVDERKSLILN